MHLVSNDASSAYSMVAATPSPMPHTGGATPMLTWGEVDSTPLLLDSNTDVGPLSSKASEPVFRIPEPPKREVLSKKLSDEASKNLRMRQKKPGTPFLASR
jgi:protein DGCR14